MRRFSDYGPSLIVLFTAALVLFAGPVAVREITFHRNKAEIQQASLRLEQNDLLSQLNQAYRDIATRVEPSVVHVSAEQYTMDLMGNSAVSLSSGSGWVYDEHGHVVTNYHVVRDARHTEVQLFDGDIREAELVGFDESTDIAVLKIPPGRLHPAARAPSGEHVRQGDMVFAFGSPFDFRFSMSSGVVSGMGRSVGLIQTEAGGVAYENFIQVDAAINPGNSGGPLTNHRGEVIAMNTAIATRRSSGGPEESSFAGIGLAIPMSMIEPVVDQLVKTGVVNKGYLGISGVDRDQSIGYELAAGRFRGYGVVVGLMEPDHPARRAGMRVGDLIVSVNGVGVVTPDEIIAAAAAGNPDEDALLTIRRYDEASDSILQVPIRLPGVVARTMNGVSMLTVDDPVRKALEMIGYTGHGVRIVRCPPGQPARAAGIKRYDIITHVNGEPTSNMDQLRSVISSILPGNNARLQIWRYDYDTREATDLTIDVPVAKLNTVAVTGLLPPNQSRSEIPEVGIAKMATASHELARKYETEFYPGVVIEEIVPGSSLDGAIAVGSIIVRVMDRPITDVDDFIALLRRCDLRDSPHVTLISPDGQSYQIRLRINE